MRSIIYLFIAVQETLRIGNQCFKVWIGPKLAVPEALLPASSSDATLRIILQLVSLPLSALDKIVTNIGGVLGKLRQPVVTWVG